MIRTASELLPRLARRHLDEEAVRQILQSDAKAWEGLAEQAQRHRVTPLVYASLKRLGAGRVPRSVIEEMREPFRLNAARSLRLLAELRFTLDQLARNGIRVIPFKGLVLAEAIYGDVSLREAGDLDLLVPREQIIQAADVLVSLGHRPIFPTASDREERYLLGLRGAQRDTYLRWHGEHHLVCGQRMVNVDLHWAFSLREFALALDVEGMWTRTRTLRLARRDLPTLSDEDLLLVLCVNGAKDCWERLDRVCDVAGLLRASAQLNWQQIFAAAARAGAMRILGLGLLLASELLGAPLPREVATRIQRDSGLKKVTQEVQAALMDETRISGSRAARSLFHLRMRERFRDRARYCLAHLRPGVGDWAALPLPGALSFLHYLIRPFRLAARYGIECVRRPATGPPLDRVSASPPVRARLSS